MKKLLVGLLLVVGLTTCSAAESASAQAAVVPGRLQTLLFNDGQTREVSRELCLRFTTLKNLLDDLGEADNAPIPISVCSSCEWDVVGEYFKLLSFGGGAAEFSKTLNASQLALLPIIKDFLDRKEHTQALLFNDGQTREVSRELCLRFTTLENLLDDLGEDDAASIPVSACSSSEWDVVVKSLKILDGGFWDALLMRNRGTLALLLKVANFLNLKDTEESASHEYLIRLILKTFSLEDLNFYCIALSGQTYFDVAITKKVMKEMLIERFCSPVRAYNIHYSLFEGATSNTRHRELESLMCRGWRSRSSNVIADEERFQSMLTLLKEKDLYQGITPEDLIPHDRRLQGTPVSFNVNLENSCLMSLAGLEKFFDGNDDSRKSQCEKIDCSLNDIKIIRANDFKGYFFVENLNLDHNPIAVFESESLIHLPRLKKLSLIGNNLNDTQKRAILESIPQDCSIIFGLPSALERAAIDDVD